MVSLGTFLTLGIIAAIAAGGYAVYANAGKIGGALSRGVETQLTDPLGNYLDTLWSNVTTSSISAVSEGVQTSLQQTQQSLVDAWNNLINSGQDAIGLAVNPIYPWMTTQQSPTPDPIDIQPLPTVDPIPIVQPTFTEQSGSFQEGYYYFNFLGSKWDYQTKLTAEQAGIFSKEALQDPTDYFQNIKYLGQSKLGEAGLKLFASSQNYL